MNRYTQYYRLSNTYKHYDVENDPVKPGYPPRVPNEHYAGLPNVAKYFTEMFEACLPKYF